MSNTSFICTLSSSEQAKARALISGILHAEGMYSAAAVDEAMCGRLCDIGGNMSGIVCGNHMRYAVLKRDYGGYYFTGVSFATMPGLAALRACAKTVMYLSGDAEGLTYDEMDCVARATIENYVIIDMEGTL